MPTPFGATMGVAIHPVVGFWHPLHVIDMQFDTEAVLDEQPLPHGWAIAFDGEGMIFYDVRTLSSQREEPTEAAPPPPPPRPPAP